MSELNYVDFKYKARYYTSGHINDNTKYLCIAFHGYGQLAKYFIKDFESLGDEHITIMPEGLHHFYKEGMSGRVVASWMTKEDRLTDIENQSNYINEVLSQVKEEVKGKDVKIWILGFSQGVATAMRWIVNNRVDIDSAIFWAGSLPEDLEVNEVSKAFKNIKCYSVIGDKDPFFQNASLQKQKELENKYSLDIEKLSFDGEHKVMPMVLKEIVKEQIES